MMFNDIVGTQNRRTPYIFNKFQETGKIRSKNELPTLLNTVVELGKDKKDRLQDYSPGFRQVRNFERLKPLGESISNSQKRRISIDKQKTIKFIDGTVKLNGKQNGDTKQIVKRSNSRSGTKHITSHHQVNSESPEQQQRLLWQKTQTPIIKLNYTYYVDRGNNSELVKRILKLRPWLHEQTSISNVNFRWKPTSKDLNYSMLSQHPNNKRLIYNHIEQHKEISTKQKLYHNLLIHCSKLKINVNQFIPQTFILNIDGASFQQDLIEFIEEFLKQKAQHSNRNFWIMKPPEMNRGQGIHLITDLRQFTQILLDFCKIKTSVPLGKTVLKTISISYPGDKFDINRDSSGMTTLNFVVEQIPGATDRQIIIQKYLENPMLYNGRKFDFRVWVLLDHSMNLYFFKEGYLRLCSELFEMTAYSSRNLYIHLTNNAIQQKHPKYSKIELGNQLSFSDLQTYCNSKGMVLNIRETVVARMKDLIKMTMTAVSDKFAQCQRKFQFEIFGYDFMLDANANVWLIEINTNPCLEESSPLLEKLIPRMINDSFRLTIDKVLNPLKLTDTDKLVPDRFYDFLDQLHVPGYNNNDIMWEYMGLVC